MGLFFFAITACSWRPFGGPLSRQQLGANQRAHSQFIHKWASLRNDSGLLAAVGVTLALLLSSVYAAAKPENAYPHYLFLLLAPWSVSIALAILWAQKSNVSSS